MDSTLESRTDGRHAGMLPATVVAHVPIQATVPDLDTLDALTSGDAVAIVVAGNPIGNPGVLPVLSGVARLPQFTETVLRASAATMVTAASASAASASASKVPKDVEAALCSAASGLWYLLTDAATDAVRAACSGDAHVQQCSLVSLVMDLQVNKRVPHLAQALVTPADAVHVYVLPEDFPCVAAAAAPLVQFTQDFELLAVAGTDVLYMLPRGPHSITTPIAKLVIAGTTDPQYRIGAACTADDAALLQNPDTVFGPGILAPVSWTLSFGREDLLAIALSGNAAITVFCGLCALHCGTPCGMPAVASPAVTRRVMAAMQACMILPPAKSKSKSKSKTQTKSQTKPVLSPAAALAALGKDLTPGIVLQLVFGFRIQAAVEQLLQDLAAAVFVCVAEDASLAPDLVFIGPPSAADALPPTTTFTHTLHVPTGAVQILPTPQTRAASEVVAWSEAPLRGVVIGATALAAALGFGSEHVVEALNVLADLGTATINDGHLHALGTRDTARLQAALAEAEMSDNV
jgi:hypothetical protein